MVNGAYISGRSSQASVSYTHLTLPTNREEPEEADGIVAAEYEKGVRRSGRVFNILKVMSRSPQALQASMRMYIAVMFGESDLSRAQREMLATVVSWTNDCFY